MLALEDMTSPLRVALAGAIVGRARGEHGSVEMRARLAQALSLRGFEDRTTDELVDMAAQFEVSEEAVADLCVKHDAQMVPLVARHLCGTCLDERVVRLPYPKDDHFTRCPDCNTPTVVERFDPSTLEGDR